MRAGVVVVVAVVVAAVVVAAVVAAAVVAVAADIMRAGELFPSPCFALLSRKNAVCRKCLIHAQLRTPHDAKTRMFDGIQRH